MPPEAPHTTYVGRSETREDRLDERLLRGMAATLGVAIPDTLPPLWHWMLFQDWVMPAGIGVDGHPQRGGFLPPVHDLPRRMWAGGRLTFGAPLRAGDHLTRTSTIVSVNEKSAAPAGWFSSPFAMSWLDPPALRWRKSMTSSIEAPRAPR
jgi:3-methylfumaryl-CoA hydratase